MLVATCPTHEELLDYAVGKLSEEAADALAGHLDSCANCQAELAALPDADDTLVGRLRGPLPSDPILDEPECSRAVAQARAIAKGDADTTNLPRLLGEYQLTAKLGSGGMGTVYKALHTKLGRVVAVKVLTHGRTHDPAAVARFEREMQAVGQLDHRHIVRAHDAREIDGTPILVMEYLDGLDLGEIVRRVSAGVPALAGVWKSPAKAGTPAPARGLSVPDAAELARQTAVGLQTIHEHGLVHRDIKPSNLMLTADGEVKILDLGLARLRPDAPTAEEMTATGQGMGTADYMAPEQASDSRGVDIRADIYSLGCTLYKLLTRRAPFSGPEYRTALEKMNAHIHTSPPPIRDLASAVPQGLATVVNRMLAKNPAERFSTPAEVAQALRPYCASADLVTLLRRSQSIPPLPPPEGRGEGSGMPSKGPSPAPKPVPRPASRGWKRFVGHLVLLLMAGVLGFGLAVILRIHKDGKDTTVELPDGSNARISANGQVDVELPKTTNQGQTVAATPISKTRKANSNKAETGIGEVNAAAPLPTVRVTQPVVCDVCDYEEYTGRIDRKQVVWIRVPEKGIPVCQFKRGMTVKKGDLLAEIVSKDDWARLKEKGEALSRLATLPPNYQLDRLGGRSGLSGDNVVSTSVEELWKPALVEWNLARGNTKTVKILAPCSGETSAAVGSALRGGLGGRGGGQREEIEAGTTIGRITASDSLVVTFDVPEQAVLAHRRVPNRKPNWELSLPVVFGLTDEKGFPYRGEVISVPADIDPSTHAQRWEAVVPNKDGIFMPGMSVRVRLVTSEPHKVLLIPADYLNFPHEDRKHETVRIVTGQNVMESRIIKSVRRYDQYDAVEGLSANDWVAVSDSFLQLPIGTVVNPEKVTTPPPSWATVSVPPSVTVAYPVERDVTDYEDFTGRIEAAKSAEIRPRVTGNLVKVNVKPGMSVKQGDILFDIDPRLYQAEFNQAAGNVKEAQIRLNARMGDFKRIEALSRTAAVSQAEVDQAKNQRAEAEAAVLTAEAALQTARLRLDFTKVAAPFSGKISGPLLDEGNVVTADKTVLARLDSTDPARLVFDIDERTVSAIRKAEPTFSPTVLFGLAGETGFPHQAKLDSVDGRVDPNTGTLRCRALLPNKDELFVPGMFARVRLATSAPHKSLLVLDGSLGSDQGQKFVFVVKNQGALERRDVEIGHMQDDGMRVVTKGVTADDWVVTSGVDKLKPGMTVKPEKGEIRAK
jgi:RND family efflux transporter MFP subunit